MNQGNKIQSAHHFTYKPYIEQHSLLLTHIPLPTLPSPHVPKMLGAAPPVDGLVADSTGADATAWLSQCTADVPQYP
jgi:hypothetical protein